LRTNASIAHGSRIYPHPAARTIRSQQRAIQVWDVERALHAAGFLAQRQGDYRQAIEFTEESLSRSRRIGDQWGIHYAINNLCLCALSIGDVERTISLAHENLALARETGIKPAVPTSLSSLGLAAYWNGDLVRSRRYLLEAVGAAREIGFEAFTSWLLGQLADVTRAIGEEAGARAYADESIEIGERIGDQYGPALGWRVHGRIAVSEDDYNTGRALFDRSLEAFHRNGYKLRAIETVEDLAELALKDNEPGRALRLLSATERLRSDENCRVPPARRSALDATREIAVTMLDPESAENAQIEGQYWSYERVITYSRS
jgi:tetratricopeptide (TPR) repeat protein